MGLLKKILQNTSIFFIILASWTIIMFLLIIYIYYYYSWNELEHGGATSITIGNNDLLKKTGPEEEETFIIAILGYSSLSFKILAYTSNYNHR